MRYTVDESEEETIYFDHFPIRIGDEDGEPYDVPVPYKVGFGRFVGSRNLRMSERSGMLAWAFPSEQEEDEVNARIAQIVLLYLAVVFLSHR